VDDSSGETIELVITQDEHRSMMPDLEDQEMQERLWKRRQKSGRIDVGSLIKVKGEIQEKWKIRKIHVMKLGIFPCHENVLLMIDIVTDQNVETQAWEDRVSFKRTVLSKPWKLPPSILSKHHNPKPITTDTSIRTQPKNTKPKVQSIDFKTLPLSAHSTRYLKLLILSHINTLQRFTPAELLALENIHFAATCVANHDFPKGVTERIVTSIFLGTINLLLRDGNIILPKQQSINGNNKSLDETFIVVGRWNLGSTIKSVAKRDGKVIVRELWKKIVAWGNGWEGITKGVVGGVVEEVLTSINGEEWIETKSGIWTRLYE
jgi:hypothetical protein